LPEKNPEVNIWTFGNSFIRAYYTIFDAENRQIGLLEGIKLVEDEFFTDSNFIPSEVSETEEELWDENDPFSTGLFFEESSESEQEVE
jgi:hypothetical protein